jgi:hypothetical protein
MEIAILFGGIIAASTVVALISARRLGVLVMGLAVGSLLSNLWSDWLAGVLSGTGLEVAWLPVGVVSSVILQIVPLVLLLISGPRYSGRFERIFSALVIGVMVGAFLVKPLGQYLVLSGDSLIVYKHLLDWWQYIVTAGLIIGVVDIFVMHTQKKSDKKKS